MSKKTRVQPFVSVCTPTFNRRPFIPIMFECFRNQTYPKDKIEWIIIDDGTDKIKDLVRSANIPQIKYYDLPEKLTLGAKRNLMHEKTKGSIIVYMDDDDYYPPERIEHAVETLLGDKKALCAGSSELYLYFKHIQKMYQCGPYGPNHATAGTFAFKRELLSTTRYNEDACIAEEREFLKGYTIPFVQLDPLKTILVFSHEHNTYDKRRLLENANGHFMKESDKTIEMFIKFNDEAKIKRFFTKEIDEKLAKYEPGRPDMKPDVLKQTAELDEKRKEKMANNQTANNQGMIMLQSEGRDPIHLGPNEVITVINSLREHIKTLTERNAELESQQKVTLDLERKITELESRLKLATFVETELKAEIEFWKKSNSKPMVTLFPPNTEKSKSEPEVRVQI